MAGNIENISRQLVPWLIARRRPILIGALALTLVGTFLSVRLYSDLRSELEELLPSNAPSVIASHVVGPKLHSVNRLSIDIEGTNPDAIERFIDTLAARLKTLPPNLSAAVTYRIDKEEQFIRRYGGLLLSMEDLQKLRDQISAREQWERQKANPLSLESASELGPPPQVDIDAIESKYTGGLGAGTAFRNGYLQTPDGKLAVVEVRMPEFATGLAVNRKLLDAVKKIVNEVNPKSFDPTMQVGYSGQVVELVEEQETLVEDIVTSTVVVITLVIGALWLYFRRWMAIGAVLGPLTVGCAVTFGLAYILIGHLNSNTAFLGSIVVGNGINPGIILVARYVEERRHGCGLVDAIRRAWASTMPATFVASFGAGLAYVSLTVTNFRGFNQFGVIGGMGMAFCWTATYLLAPVVIAGLEGWRGHTLVTERLDRPVARRVALWVESHTAALRTVSILLLLGSLMAVLSYRGSAIEYDWTKMRSRRAIERGEYYWSKKADQVWRAYMTPIVFWSPDENELKKLMTLLEQRRGEAGQNDPIQSTRTLESLVPPDQEQKIPILMEIRDMLRPSLTRRLPPELRQKAEDFRPPEDLQPFTIAELPPAWREALSEKNGTVGHIALAFPKPIPDTDVRKAKTLMQFVRGVQAEEGGKVLVLSSLFLITDINDAVAHDWHQATIIALALVCGLVWVVFRRIKPTAQVIGSLTLGLLLLIGIAALRHIRMNFLNFVVLPITFGIGVDYAMNVVQRFRVEGPSALTRILSETGGAVALCSSTTIIGYGSLWLADSQALSGFGALAAVGEVTCLSAALLLLPAWLVRRRSEAPTHGKPAPVLRSRPVGGASIFSRSGSDGPTR